MKIPHSKLSLKRLNKVQRAFLDGKDLEIQVVCAIKAGSNWDNVMRALNKRLLELQLPKLGNKRGDSYCGGISRKKKVWSCGVRQKPSDYGVWMTDTPLTCVRDIGWDGSTIFFIGADMTSGRERSYRATSDALNDFISYRANDIKNVRAYLASGMNNRSDEWPK